MTFGKQQQIYCLAISAKRYELFVLDANGNPIVLRWSEHGLGHLLNPSDPESTDRDWIKHVWISIARKTLVLKTDSTTFEHLPAIGRITISSPAVMRGLENYNQGKRYSEQIKPFNFLLTCHVDSCGHPVGVDPERFHLVARYGSNPRNWLNIDWLDQYTGNSYRISTTESYGSRDTVRVKTYGDVLQEYEFHPEAKCADKDGNPCAKQTVGLLQRRKTRISKIRYIGKESNFLEDVEAGMLHSPHLAYTEYPDKRRDEWETTILPILKKIPLRELVVLSGMSPSQLKELRAGRSRPHPGNQERLAQIGRKHGSWRTDESHSNRGSMNV